MTNAERDQEIQAIKGMITDMHHGLLGDPANPEEPGLYDIVRKNTALIAHNRQAIHDHPSACPLRPDLDAHLIAYDQALKTTKARRKWLIGLFLSPFIAISLPYILRLAGTLLTNIAN